MAKINCNCAKYIPKPKRKYLGFVAKCISCGDLWYCQYMSMIGRKYVTWKPIENSVIERLNHG